MGQDIYWLTTPSFECTEIPLPKTEKRLVIKAPEAGEEMIYIAGATLNGKPLNRAWLHHSEIANGAELHFILSDKPTLWGRKELPPSLACRRT